MIDFYGSIGKFIGLTRETSIQTDGKVKNMDKALYVDGAATIAGASVGTSTVITYVESAVAIAQGGRSGLVAVICGVLMLASLVLAPLVTLVPIAAVSGVLLYVGWILLPKNDIKDVFSKRSASLNVYDLSILVIMGLITAFTFSLDKALLLGFVAYALKEGIEKKTINPYLAGSAVLLFIAMSLQYLAL